MNPWIKERKIPKTYPITEQQSKMAEVGKAIGKKCKGLKKKEFYNCRRKVLDKKFKKNKKEI